MLHGRLVALLSGLFIDFLLHFIVELQPYRGGVSSVQRIRYVGSSSTSSSSVPFRRSITWMSAASMGGEAVVSTQCVPHCSMLSGSFGDFRKPVADRDVPTGRSVYCIYLGQEATYRKPGLALRPALRTRPSLLLSS
jgi:hypothetical protein